MSKSASTQRGQRGTIDRLLDAAEKLFGANGFDGVGMRALAEEAKVNLGAATYHFGSKKNLYIEIFLRRLRLNNDERLRLLRQAQDNAQGQPVGVDKITECFVRPTYTIGLTYPGFHTLMTRNYLTPPPFMHATMRREIGPTMDAFVDALQRALPYLSRDTIRLRMALSMSALLGFMSFAMRQPASSRPGLTEQGLPELVRFIASGLQGRPVETRGKPANGGATPMSAQS